MLKTDNYELNIAQGTDIVNPLVMDNPNYQKIDKVMKDNEIRGIGTATELKTGSVHSITVPEQYTTFKFVATSDFTAGETFMLNGKQITAYTTNQQPLATNAYRIGATVLCSYIERTSSLTFYTIAQEVTTATNAYYLGDVPATSYMKNTYNLGETKIGTWVDGKPLYRSLIKYLIPQGDFGEGNKKTTISILHNITNIENICYMSSTHGSGYALPYVDGDETAISKVTFFTVNLSSINLISINEKWSAGGCFFFNIQYTKTTD